MQKIVYLLKVLVGVLPKSLRRKMTKVDGLVSWYRKKLNAHYFDSYNYDSKKKRIQYQKWVSDIEPSLSLIDGGYPRCSWLVLVKVDASSVDFLERTLGSINALLGGYPELLIQCDSGSRNAVRSECGKLHGGIKFSVVVNSSSAEDKKFQYDGVRYVSVLLSGDTFAPCTYQALCHAVSVNPDATLFYSDHDYLDDQEIRSRPQFKPQWNLDLYLTTAYIGRAVFAKLSREELLVLLGTNRGIEAQWGRLILSRIRFSTRPESGIVHLPRVLFHCSHEAEGDNLPPLNWSEVIQSCFDGQVIAVNNSDYGSPLCLQWPVSENLPLVTIIIPTKNGKLLVESCINSILSQSDYQNFEILLLDNQSDDPKALRYFDSLTEDLRIRVLRYDKPFNYSAINNWAVNQASGEVVALVNNDIEAIDGAWLREMVSHALRPEVGCVGAKLLYPDKSVQHAGVIIGYGGVAGHAHKYFPSKHHGYMNRLRVVHNVSAVTAACLVVKKSIYDEVGGLNEIDLKVAFNDVDFCLRVQEAGYRNVFTPHAQLYHHESVSRGSDQTGEKYKRFQSEIAYMKQRWNTHIKPDSAYNPNLTLSREDFSLRMPGEKR